MAVKAEVVAVVVFDSILYNRTGTIGRWAERTERRFTLNAKKYAPERSGELRAGIDGRINRVGKRQLITTISSHAPHSLYVLKGTTGPIMSRRMWGFQARTGLRLPRGGRMGNGAPDMRFLKANGYLLKVRAGNGYSQHYALSVDGQTANNFFNEAAEATARTNSSLRGFHPGVIGF